MSNFSDTNTLFATHMHILEDIKRECFRRKGEHVRVFQAKVRGTKWSANKRGGVRVKFGFFVCSDQFRGLLRGFARKLLRQTAGPWKILSSKFTTAIRPLAFSFFEPVGN